MFNFKFDSMLKYKEPFRFRLVALLVGVMFSMCIFAQQITIKGVVTGQTGETIIGASVVEKGTTNGTITGLDGDFTLKVSSQAIIVVSYVGYRSQEISVKGKTQLQVVLQEDSELLDEVVVVGYGTMRKSDLTGAVASVDTRDLRDRPVSNLGQAIQGKISPDFVTIKTSIL